MAENDRKNIVIAYRVNAAQAAHLATAARAACPPRMRADFCRTAALQAAGVIVPDAPTIIRQPGRRQPSHDVELLAKILAQVVAMSGHLDQFSTLPPGQGAPSARMLAGMTTDIIEIRNALRQALTGRRDGGEGNDDAD